MSVIARDSEHEELADVRRPGLLSFLRKKRLVSNCDSGECQPDRTLSEKMAIVNEGFQVIGKSIRSDHKINYVVFDRSEDEDWQQKERSLKYKVDMPCIQETTSNKEYFVAVVKQTDVPQELYFANDEFCEAFQSRERMIQLSPRCRRS